MLNLKEIRISQHKTQEEVAAYLRISRAAYTNIENGRRGPDAATLEKLSDFFGVSIDTLFGKVPVNQFLSDAENELLSVFRALNQSGMDYLLQTARMARENPQFAKDGVQVTAI